MTTAVLGVEPEFLDRQRGRLKLLHAQLLYTRGGQESEQAGENADLSGQAREFEDDAQKLAALELQDNLSVAEDERLSDIKRALIKIDEGTYGLSDLSGRRISIERLEASPESIYTFEEQRTRATKR